MEHRKLPTSPQDIRDFLAAKPELLGRILAQAPQPLASATAVNATRLAIVEMAQELCDDVRCWTGGRTKYNRVRQGFPKSHSIDAACVGESGANIKVLVAQPLMVESKGHGTRQAVRCNASGFPALGKDGRPIKAKAGYRHCQSGDIVKFCLDKDRKNARSGIYTARVKTQTPKGFEVKINGSRVAQKMEHLIRFVHRNDGYAYSF